MDSVQRKFGKIYDKYVEKIYRFIFLKTNSSEAAEDLTSEVFLRAFEKFKEDPKIIRDIRAFLYQIARNKVIDFYRKREKEKTLPADDYKKFPDENQDLEKKIYLDSQMEKIRIALASLNEDYKDIVLMRYVDGLSIKEISEILGKTEGATRVAIHRALESLRKKLEETQEI